jgi:hypothetical protein
MKKIANTQKALTDDIYYVNAADVADKLIERMRRGLDPLLFSRLFSGSYPSGSMVVDSSAENA